MIVCIDGCIGTGKSSVLDVFRSRGYVVYEEGLDNWSHILEKFYTDPHRWSFTLQMSILKDMHQQYVDILKSLDNTDLVFVERSPGSAMVFVDNSKNLGYLCEEELDLYNSYYKLLTWEPDKTIQLTAPDDICLSRIKQRNRKGEEAIDIDYLTALSKRYASLPGHRLDTERPIDEVADEILRIIQL